MAGFRAFGGGVVTALATGALLRRTLLAKLRRDVSQLNAGDHTALLAAYANHAVLRFNEGPHRWSGSHHGKAAIDRFLREFTRAGLQGEVHDLWIGGPPWALSLVARFDDRAAGPDGTQLYANRVVIVIRMRWGRIIEQDDFYEDTRRIDAFEARLRELNVEPIDAAQAVDNFGQQVIQPEATAPHDDCP